MTKALQGKPVIDPVDTVRTYATQLEAAMAVALAQPKKPAVHRLRTQTRRVEAQLTLLTQLAALPEESAEAVELRRRLRKLRRAAGRVRDLDVQSDLLEAQQGLPPEAATALREQLALDRERHAKKLRKMLFRQLPRIAGTLEQVVHSVATANGLVVPPLRLVEVIEQWKGTQAAPAAVDTLDDEQLHDARKAAKAARYMAESAADSLEASKAAARYEAVQDAGGVWHDWVDLAETSRHFFGKKHELTAAVASLRDAAKAKYVDLLR